MNVNNLKIGTQLKIGFAILLLFVVVLEVSSYLQNNELYLQIETIYEHPYIVKRAIANFKADILTIHRDMKDLFLAADEKEIAFSLNQIEKCKADAFEQINIFYSRYLGARTDIDSVKQAFIEWNSIHEETIRLLRLGRTREALSRTKMSGIAGQQAEELYVRLQIVDDFAKNKGDALFATSRELKDLLNRQEFLLSIAILLLSLIIIYIISRNIRKPIDELISATQRFRNGDMNARSSYEYKNEFGELSASFNTMAESIQVNVSLSEKVAGLSRLMLSKYEAKEFFRETINALALHTGSQMAAIYLLSDDKNIFDHFESIGTDNNARQSFPADRFEGEFGTALYSQKVQHIKNIPQDTRFVFHTVSGKFIPREIITIPILADNETVAMISLASVGMYSEQSIQLIDSIFSTLCARVEGIIAYHKIRQFSEKLDHQNRELETQKTELVSQSAELTEQNTELEMQKKQLDEASRLKTVFLSNMSHELRTPLNSVIALSGVLSRRLAKQIPEEEYSYLEVIERNGKHLLSLINDILDISRIEAGREEITIAKFDVNNLISELISMIRPQAEQKNIELLHSNRDSTLSITSDDGKCRHILQNLIGNAVKFTEKGKVEITARQSGKNIVVTVTDTGIGISKNDLPHIFDEFKQADDSTSRKFGGTGLGLAIAKKYANLLGGTISVKSTSGKCSEFTLTIPLRYAEKNRIFDKDRTDVYKYAIKQTAVRPASALSAKTILLVEDSEPAIIQMKDILEESGYQLLVARDGGEALGIMAQTIPDAMILDLMMPGIDGFEVLKTIREAERTAQIPVLILTAKHITKEELKFLKRNNVHQLIQKGDVNRSELLNAVAGIVSAQTAETEKPIRELPTIEGKPAVLVVEDNPDNMITVKALLADNYTVIEAVDGNEGIEMAKKHTPNLILMDIALPAMDGIEAFRTIKKLPKLQPIPVIALTASAMTEDRETILAYGFDAYIAKPIEEHIFFKTISELLYGK